MSAVADPRKKRVLRRERKKTGKLARKPRGGYAKKPAGPKKPAEPKFRPPSAARLREIERALKAAELRRRYNARRAQQGLSGILSWSASREFFTCPYCSRRNASEGHVDSCREVAKGPVLAARDGRDMAARPHGTEGWRS